MRRSRRGADATGLEHPHLCLDGALGPRSRQDWLRRGPCLRAAREEGERQPRRRRWVEQPPADGRVRPMAGERLARTRRADYRADERLLARARLAGRLTGARLPDRLQPPHSRHQRRRQARRASPRP